MVGIWVQDGAGLQGVFRGGEGSIGGKVMVVWVFGLCMGV